MSLPLSHFFVLPSTYHSQLKELYADVIFQLETWGVRFCCWGGTLIGALKYHGFIPWDDDIDLFVFPEDCSIIETNIIPTLDKYTVVDEGKNMTVRWRIKRLINEKMDYYLTLDVGVYYEKAERRDAPELPNEQYTSKKYMFPRRDDLLPLQKIPFENDLFVYIPSSPHKTLENCYGKDWKRHGYIYNHLINNSPWFPMIDKMTMDLSAMQTIDKQDLNMVISISEYVACLLKKYPKEKNKILHEGIPEQTKVTINEMSVLAIGIMLQENDSKIENLNVNELRTVCDLLGNYIDWRQQQTISEETFSYMHRLFIKLCYRLWNCVY